MNIVSKRIFLILFCFIGSIVFIVLLFNWSLSSTHYNKGFVRKYFPRPTAPVSSFDLKSDSFYISGASDSWLYLCNYKDAQKLVLLDTSFNKLIRKDIIFTGTRPYTGNSGRIYTGNDKIYLLDGNAPCIMSGELNSLQLRLQQDTLLFSQGMPDNAGDFILRVFDSKLKQNVLVKLDKKTPLVNTKKYILNKQVDGVFCTDGKILYNPLKNQFLYTYYFQNRYVVLDSNMQLVTEGNTIDTNSEAKIKVDFISSNVKTISTPSYYSTRLSNVDGDNLYIISGIKSENENTVWQNKASEFDVYSISKNRYLFSFYLPDNGRFTISSFIVHQKRIYFIQDKLISSYALNFVSTN